jgi:hypothetical protein
MTLEGQGENLMAPFYFIKELLHYMASNIQGLVTSQFTKMIYTKMLSAQ